MEKETIFNRESLKSLFDRVNDLKPNAQHKWGTMNVVQMLNHLKVATGSGLGIYKLKDESSILSRSIIKFIALRVMSRFPKNAGAPKGFGIEMYDELDFFNERNEVLTILEASYNSNFKTHTHPLFGVMTKTLWGKLIHRHFDHHLRQFGV